jgi:hypothetical protein
MNILMRDVPYQSASPSKAGWGIKTALALSAFCYLCLILLAFAIIRSTVFLVALNTGADVASANAFFQPWSPPPSFSLKITTKCTPSQDQHPVGVSLSLGSWSNHRAPALFLASMPSSRRPPRPYSRISMYGRNTENPADLSTTSPG